MSDKISDILNITEEEYDKYVKEIQHKLIDYNILDETFDLINNSFTDNKNKVYAWIISNKLKEIIGKTIEEINKLNQEKKNND